MPRGNTLDSRFAQLAVTNGTSNAVASHSTTVGINSQNASRPGSAFKKATASPNTNKTNSIALKASNPNEFKNIMLLNKKSIDGKQILAINKPSLKGKELEIAQNASGTQHKKANSASTTSKNLALKSAKKQERKNLNLDYNSLALEQILQTHLDS